MLDRFTNLAILAVCCYIAFAVWSAKPRAEVPAIRQITLPAKPTWREIGPSSSPKVIVIVSDYECPFCSKILSSDFYAAARKGAGEGKIRLAVADFPLAMHSHAKEAAEAARCANEQGKFWQMDAALHENFHALESEPLFRYAGDLRMDQPAFKACMASHRYAQAIEAEAAVFRGLEVNSTPTVILAKFDELGRMKGSLFAAAPSAADTTRWINK